jgi:hypothetical protein
MWRTKNEKTLPICYENGDTVYDKRENQLQKAIKFEDQKMIPRIMENVKEVLPGKEGSRKTIMLDSS